MLFVQPKLVEGNYIQLKNTFTHHSGEVWEVKFAPNGELDATGAYNGKVRLWDVDSGKLLKVLMKKKVRNILSNSLF
jgi:WD40 repeat protein